MFFASGKLNSSSSRCVWLILPLLLTTLGADAVRMQQVSSVSSAASNTNECSNILKDGIRNYWKKKLQTSSSYEAEQRLRKFDEDYSYENFVQDHANARASDSSTSVSASVSSSYGLFSIDVDVDTSHSNSQMSEDAFHEAKAKIVQQKRELEQSSSSSGGAGYDEEVVSRTVSSEITEAWRDCQQFAQQQILSSIAPEESGKALHMGLRYVLGTGRPTQVPPMLTAIQIVPPFAAICRTVSTSGKHQRTLPLALEVGHPVHVYCDRAPGNTDRITVFLMTNVVETGLRGRFTDVVDVRTLAKVKEEIKEDRSLINEAREETRSQVNAWKAEASASSNALKSDLSSLKSDFNSLSSDFKSLESKLTGQLTSFKSSQNSISSSIDRIEQKINNGMCAVCYSCGGEWPHAMGGFTVPNKAEIHGKGPECQGSYDERDDKPRVCCASAD
mmetsp:Transcript_55697/g.122278  ORF Transcript_55697/g.122278 Transcript_55697/m.122278 type:complete len:446 (+) Transcript_55697:71-1408(+)